jgi:hypothetical protein
VRRKTGLLYKHSTPTEASSHAPPFRSLPLSNKARRCTELASVGRRRRVEERPSSTPSPREAPPNSTYKRNPSHAALAPRPAAEAPAPSPTRVPQEIPQEENLIHPYYRRIRWAQGLPTTRYTPPSTECGVRRGGQLVSHPPSSVTPMMESDPVGSAHSPLPVHSPSLSNTYCHNPILTHASLLPHPPHRADGSGRAPHLEAQVDGGHGSPRAQHASDLHSPHMPPRAPSRQITVQGDCRPTCPSFGGGRAPQG